MTCTKYHKTSISDIYIKNIYTDGYITYTSTPNQYQTCEDVITKIRHTNISENKEYNLGNMVIECVIKQGYHIDKQGFIIYGGSLGIITLNKTCIVSEKCQYIDNLDMQHEKWLPSMLGDCLHTYTHVTLYLHGCVDGDVWSKDEQNCGKIFPMYLTIGFLIGLCVIVCFYYECCSGDDVDSYRRLIDIDQPL